MAEATDVLGIKKDNLHLLKYDVRTFNFNRQAILDDIINFKIKINPDLVFIPSISDIHQDHSTVANEAVRAFKFCNILSYEMPWNNFNFSTTSFMLLNEEHLNIKIKALKKYKSQEHRPYANEEFIRSLASVRGVQVSQKMERYLIIRLIS